MPIQKKSPIKKKRGGRINNRQGRKAIKFTPREEQFCHEWIIDMNDTQAAIRAKYSRKTAGAMGHELLKKPKIKERIDQLRHAALLRADLTTDIIINELKHLGFYSIKDFVGENNTIVDLSKLSREVLKPVVGIKYTERFDPDGKPVRMTELKMADKKGAIVDLGRHLGIFEKDNAQKTLKIKVTRK